MSIIDELADEISLRVVVPLDRDVTEVHATLLLLLDGEHRTLWDVAYADKKASDETIELLKFSARYAVIMHLVRLERAEVSLARHRMDSV